MSRCVFGNTVINHLSARGFSWVPSHASWWFTTGNNKFSSTSFLPPQARKDTSHNPTMPLLTVKSRGWPGFVVPEAKEHRVLVMSTLGRMETMQTVRSYGTSWYNNMLFCTYPVRPGYEPAGTISLYKQYVRHIPVYEYRVYLYLFSAEATAQRKATERNGRIAIDIAVSRQCMVCRYHYHPLPFCRSSCYLTGWLFFDVQQFVCTSLD